MGVVSFSFFLVAVCGLLPFMSHLILKLETFGQARGEEGDSWALNNNRDDDVMSVTSGQSIN
jgi:hypothetical protein